MDGTALKNKSQSSIVEIIKRDVMHKQSFYRIQEEREQKIIDDEIKKEANELDQEEEILNKEDSPVKIEDSKEEAKFEKYQSNTYIPYYDKIPKDMNQELADDEFELVNEDDVFGSNPLVAAEADKNEGTKVKPRKNSIVTKPLRLPKSENNSRFTPIM